jgi:DedD protein
MDRRVKERLIGATILLVLVVLVVPELLSGPKGQGGSPPLPPAAGVGPAGSVRNVTVDLATSQATSAADPAEAASAPASAATGTPSDPAAGPARPGTDALGADLGGAAAEGPATGVGADPTITTLKAQSEPAAQPAGASPVRPAAPSHHGWTVQVGSFASRENAEKLLQRMKPRNPSAHVSSSGSGAALRYRVRIGPLPDRGAAEHILAKLRKEGVSAGLVAP